MPQLTAEQIIFNILSNDATVKGLVGNNIFPDVAHEGTEQTWITFVRISNLRVSSHGGYDGLSESRYQINCWSLDATVRTTLREAVLAAFDELDESITINAVTTSFHTAHENDMNEFEEGPPKRFGSRIDFKVWI